MSAPLVDAPVSTAELATALTDFVSWWRRTAPRDDLSLTALSTLDQLDRSGPARLGELAAAQRVTQPAMTALVKRCEAGGLLARAADAGDGRVALVALTDAGRSHVAAARAARSGALAELLTALPDTDVRALERAVPALTRLVSGGHL